MLVLADRRARSRCDADERRLLRAVAAAVGFALLRDRLVAELRAARR